MKTLFITAILFCSFLCATAQNIIQAEYFLDEDAGFGKNTIINLLNPQPDGAYSFTVNLAGAGIGYHKLYLRTKDIDGNWGQTSRRNIEVISSNSIKVVTAAEYFIDADAGFGQATPITVNPQNVDILESFTANLTTLPVGYHKLYIRTKDNDGNWGITTRRNIEVLPPNESIRITEGEYFFDTDPGFGEANPVIINPTDTLILQNFVAATASLSIGYHKLYIRVKDNTGKWGITSRRNVEVVNANVFVVSGVEYFFNADPGVGKARRSFFANPAADSSFTFKIPVSEIPAGAHTLYLRVKDSVNNSWSLTQWQVDSVVTSVQSGKWSQPATWSNNKIPDANTVVLLFHNVDVDIIDAVCKSLTPYGNSVQCNIEAGKALKITGIKN